MDKDEKTFFTVAGIITVASILLNLALFVGACLIVKAIFF